MKPPFRVNVTTKGRVDFDGIVDDMKYNDSRVNLYIETNKNGDATRMVTFPWSNVKRIDAREADL